MPPAACAALPCIRIAGVRMGWRWVGDGSTNEWARQREWAAEAMRMLSHAHSTRRRGQKRVSAETVAAMRSHSASRGAVTPALHRQVIPARHRADDMGAAVAMPVGEGACLSAAACNGTLAVIATHTHRTAVAEAVQ
jgi:hypothetical protein